MKSIKKMSNFLFLLLFLLPAFIPAEPVPDCGCPQILVIHSYSIDYQWTSDTSDAIVSTMKKELPACFIRSEFMDTKNYSSDEYTSALASLYAEKYAEARPDGIIITDNNALDFFYEYGNELFPDTPAVACGINNGLPPRKDSTVRCIITEGADHLETIRQGLRIQPETDTVYVISDTSNTGRLLEKEVRIAAAGFEENIEFVYINNFNISELSDFAAARTQTELLYVLPFFRTIDNEIFSQGQVETILAEASAVPVMVSWEYQLGSGALGGRVISSYSHGEKAAEKMLEILDGTEVEPFISGLENYRMTHKSIYDYRVVRAFDINTDRLPDDVVFINKPPSFYEQHINIIIPALLSTSVLLLLIILLYLNLKKQKDINSYNNQVLRLNREIISTQQEMVTNLGEIIESRSQETGSHVERVCKLTRFFGEHMGLNEHDLDLLERSASLHDVGKLGIPEEILHKPGKLTEEEFNIIKSHTDIGHEILKGSDRELLKTARVIAHQHHERWDGTGYPAGLKADEISIFARITMLADIYDALASDRSYKKAWTEDKIIEYIKFESGKAFDPKLVKVFLANLDGVRDISIKYGENPEQS